MHRVYQFLCISFFLELYDESCLLENPYFQVSNMNCWPCENIKFVLNLTDSKQNNAHVGLPYIIKVNYFINNNNNDDESFISFPFEFNYFFDIVSG